MIINYGISKRIKGQRFLHCENHSFELPIKESEWEEYSHIIVDRILDLHKGFLVIGWAPKGEFKDERV